MFLTYRSIAIFFSLLLATQAFAQVEHPLKPSDLLDMSLEEMLNVKVHVSSTIPKDIFNTTSTVTIVDRETIERYNFLSVAEAVRIVAGVEILQTTIDQNVPTIRGVLQNFYANKVLIMINSIPVWQPTYGNTSLDRISINDIERIEVLKGPGSVLYGTNAYNGVINVVLLNPEDTQVRARIDAGLPGLGSAAVNYFQKKGDWTFKVSGSGYFEDRKNYLFRGGLDTLVHKDTIPYNGDSIHHTSYLYADDTLYSIYEDFKNFTFNAEVGFKQHLLFVNAFGLSYTDQGNSATFRTGANRKNTDKGALISYTYNKSYGDNTQLRLNAHYDYFTRNDVLDQAYGNRILFASSRLSGSAKLNHNFTNQFKGEFGLEVFDGKNLGHKEIGIKNDLVINDNIKSKEDLIEGSVFTQFDYSLKRLNLLLGGRYTYNTTFGGNISPRFTAVFNISKSNAIKFIYGQSFRTPNLLELHFDHNTVVGNPDLHPEKCTSYELMYLARVGSFFMQLTGYHSKYDDLIQRIRVSDDINVPASYRNLQSFEGYGVEAEIKYQNPKIFNSTISYNYMDGIGDNANSNFRYVPNHTISVAINKPIKNFFISTNLYSYSKTSGHVEEISAQMNLNLHLGYKHHNEKGMMLTHTLSLRNITDSDMLIPEYIRKRPGVNALPTTGYGRQINYTLSLIF